MAQRLQSMDELFKGRHFEREIMVLCVRWYLRFKLSLRDLVEMMAERGLGLAHTTIMRWVQRFVPDFDQALESVRSQGRSVMARRRNLREDPRHLDLPVPGRRSRAADRGLSPERQPRCQGGQGVLSQSAGLSGPTSREHHAGRLRRLASRRARVARAEPVLERRAPAVIKVLDNMIEQDHRGVKSRIKPMLGFKIFEQAAVTIAGVELLHRIRKGQFNLARLRVKGQATPAIWNAVLSA